MKRPEPYHVMALWSETMDTAGIAKRLSCSEAAVANMLSRCLDRRHAARTKMLKAAEERRARRADLGIEIDDTRPVSVARVGAGR